MKPPQLRKTPYDFSDDTQFARVEATGGGVHIQTRSLNQGSYVTEMGLRSREDVKRLRDILDAWLEYDEQQTE